MWIRKQVSICCDHHLPHGAIDCGLWNVVLHLFNGCAGFWRELEHVVIHVDPEHPKHAQWVTCLVHKQVMEDLGNF